MLKRLPATAALMAGISAAYMLVNRFHVFAPAYLPMSLIDAAVPYRPEFFALYLSHFVFLPLSLLCLASDARFARTVKAMIWATAISCAVFVVHPTTFPRPESAGFLRALLVLLDTPANCFPSLHVSLAVISSRALFEDGRRWAVPGALWAAAICASTVLVKQHYAADVAGGLLVAAASLALAARRAPEPAPAGEPA